MDARWRKNPRENGSTRHGLESTLKILMDLGDVLQNVPYVSAVAAVALRILQIRNEIKQNKELALEVINRVAQRCRGLFLSLRSLAAQNIVGLEDLREDLERYQQLLSQIHIELQKIASQRSLSSVFQREKHKDALQRYLRDLAEFDGSFSTQRLTALTLQFHMFMARLPPEQTNMNIMFQEARPPEPTLCIGREDEHAFILDFLWKNAASGSRFAILGPGGMGKTTLAQSILNHPKVMEWFSDQLFVSCETLDTVSAILNALGNVLHIADRGQNLQLKILDALRGERKILCLDNFEDPWDLIRRDSEKLLGEQYPDDVPWTLPRFPPLKSLSLPDATTVFECISGHNDEYVTKLLKAVDCVPLAVDLLAHQVLNDGTKAVWKRWEIEGLKLLDLGDGHDDRKSSVNASISLSLSSSRIANHPSASDILRLITYLPDGLEVEFTTRLQKFLPTSVNLAQSLRVLVGASLLTKETTGSTTQHHMLAPIRQYVEQFVPAKDEFTTALVEAYVELMTEAGQDTEDHEKQKVTLPELQNVARVLLLAFSSPLDHKDAWFRAVFNYVMWYRIHCAHKNVLGGRIMALASERAQGLHLIAPCYRFSARLLHGMEKNADAEEAYLKALGLYQEAGNLLDEGLTRRWLAMLYEDMDRLEEAEKLVLKALEQHRSTESILNQARDTMVMGTIYRRLKRFEDAEHCFKDAILLAKSCHSKYDEGQAGWELGVLYSDFMSRPEDAEAAYIESARLSAATALPWREGWDRIGLAELYMDNDRLDEAEVQMLRAIGLLSKCHDISDQAYAMYMLGRLYSKAKNWDKAAVTYQKAAHLYQMASEVDDEAKSQWALGDVYEKQLGRPEDAATAFLCCAELRQQSGVFGQEGDARQDLAQVFITLNRFGDAEIQLLRSLEAYNLGDCEPEVKGWASGELGTLYVKMERWEAAADAFQTSVRFYHDTDNTTDEGYASGYLGEIYHLHLKRVEDAEASYLRALELDQKAGEFWNQGWVRQRLADLYIQLNRFDEAETSLVTAIENYRDANDHAEEAAITCKLGKFYSQQSNYQKAANTFLAAVQLFQKLKLTVNEAEVQLDLGDLFHLNLGRYAEAEAAYQQAIACFSDERTKTRGDAEMCLAELYILKMGCLEKAIEVLHMVRDTHRHIKAAHGEAWAAGYFGVVYRQLGRYDDAIAAFLEAIELNQQAGSEWNDAWARENLADVYLQQWPRRLDDAEHQLNKSIELYKQHGTPTDGARATTLLQTVAYYRQLSSLPQSWSTGEWNPPLSPNDSVESTPKTTSPKSPGRFFSKMKRIIRGDGPSQ
ncbi:hypothetical protein C8J56DRAFT_1168528 [Mycena floridula]|nr:hypothetical protein C8J56DRAFT_1168528 [Mycena floridula]